MSALSLGGHTPGPWRVDAELDVYRRRFHIRSAISLIAECTVGRDAKGVPLANANLIAAAPTMFEALEALEPWAKQVVGGYSGPPNDVVGAAQHVIEALGAARGGK